MLDQTWFQEEIHSWILAKSAWKRVRRTRSKMIHNSPSNIRHLRSLITPRAHAHARGFSVLSPCPRYLPSLTSPPSNVSRTRLRQPGNCYLFLRWPPDISTCIMAVPISSCCRWLSSRICSRSCLNSTVVKLSSLSCTGRVLRSANRVPLRCPRAYYYVKPKEKKGPSMKGWVMFGAGCVGVATGAVIYLGKRSVIHCLNTWRGFLFNLELSILE